MFQFWQIFETTNVLDHDVIDENRQQDRRERERERANKFGNPTKLFEDSKQFDAHNTQKKQKECQTKRPCKMKK